MKKKKLPEIPKMLTQKEMDIIDRNTLAEAYRKVSIECYNLKIELLNKEVENLRMKKMGSMQKFAGERKNYGDFIHEIQTRLGIEAGFGFNPDTGEIVD